MERVEVTRALRAAPELVWRTIRDIESYPSHMDHVLSIEVLEDCGSVRRAKWEVLLRGSVLRWEERGVIDDDQHRITFCQVHGDLSHFEGSWELVPAPEHVDVKLVIEFEIGIPLLADMLNPVARRSLLENLNSMLDDIEARSEV